MKLGILSRGLVVAIFALASTACAGLNAPIDPAAQQALAQTATDLHNAATDLHAAAGVLGTTSAPAAKAVEKVAANADKGATLVQASAAAATQPAATPVTVIVKTVEAASDAGMIPEPYAAYVKLGLMGVGLLEYLRQRAKAKSSDAAATSMQSGISAAIGNGSMVVTPKAAATVDALITNHPAAVEMVDTIAAAAKGGAGGSP